MDRRLDVCLLVQFNECSVISGLPFSLVLTSRYSVSCKCSVVLLFDESLRSRSTPYKECIMVNLQYSEVYKKRANKKSGSRIPPRRYLCVIRPLPRRGKQSTDNA